MKLIAVALLLLAAPALSASAQITGASLGAPTVGGGGGGGSITAAIDCRSFGQTASDGGTLNIKYATPIMCWATDSVVSGTQVNGAGWVPETYFAWDWDDNSLGTVSRAGLTVDLGKSIGLVAAHAFKPSTYAETCNGGTNSSHTVTLTVYSVVGGVRESDSATMTVCVENPATTWPTPVAYCDDADCSNDSFTNVVNPGTPTHGGNGTALNTILQACGSGSKRILLEGGVSFSTGSTGITVGANSCLVESYGTGNAELKFTAASAATAIAATHANCAGYRFNDVTFAGGGVGPTLIGGAADTGCYAIIDSDVSTTAGEELYALSIVNPVGNNVQLEGYYIKLTFDRQVGNDTQAYIYGNYTVFLGGELSGLTTNSNNNIRLPQWQRVVVDGMKFEDSTSHIITPRQDCGGTSSCPNFASASEMTISRSYFLQSDKAVWSAVTDPFEVCSSGSGAEQTKCYDIEFLNNLFTWVTTTEVDDYIYLQGSGSAGSEIKRVRIFGNALDISAQDSTNSRMVNIGVADDVALIGNVIVDTGAATTSRVMSNGNAQLDIVKNNGCFDAGNRCDMFPAYAEDTGTNPEVTSNPFSVSPGQFNAFDFTDVTIANGSAFDDVGVLPVYPTDVILAACDSLYDVGPYCTP